MAAGTEKARRPGPSLPVRVEPWSTACWPGATAAARRPTSSTRLGRHSSELYSCCSHRGGAAGQRRCAGMPTCEDMGFTQLAAAERSAMRPCPRRPPELPVFLLVLVVAGQVTPRQVVVAAGSGRAHVQHRVCGQLQVCCATVLFSCRKYCMIFQDCKVQVQCQYCYFNLAKTDLHLSYTYHIWL